MSLVMFLSSHVAIDLILKIKVRWVRGEFEYCQHSEKYKTGASEKGKIIL